MSNLSGLKKLLEVSTNYRLEDRPGVYLLYKSVNGPVRYVGRSDTSLRSRLKWHRTNNEYKYYRFKHCSLKEAYEWECKYWHKYKDTIDNSSDKYGIHPASPNGKYWTCPVCGK